MENTNNTLEEKIRSYIAGELGENEKKEFLLYIEKNKTAAEELAFSKSLAIVLQNPELVSINVLIKQVIAEEGFPPPSKPDGINWKLWGVGFAVLSILAATLFWRADPLGITNSANQQLVRAHLKPLEDVFATPPSNATIADLDSGMKAYDAGNYEEASRLLSAYINKTGDVTAGLYLGVSLLMTGQSSAALDPLFKAMQSPEPPVREAASWYLGLAHLDRGNHVSAVSLFESIPANGFYYEQARELLKELK